MIRPIALAAALAGLSLAFVACGRNGPARPDWRVIHLYAGETSVDLLQHPARVQMFRIDPDRPRAKEGEPHVGPYAAATTPVDVPADAAAELSAILADADSYDWQHMKNAPFRPGVGLSFQRGAYALEIALDLDSAKLKVFAGDQPLPWQDCDPARERLAAIVKRLL